MALSVIDFSTIPHLTFVQEPLIRRTSPLDLYFYLLPLMMKAFFSFAPVVTLYSGYSGSE